MMDKACSDLGILSLAWVRSSDYIDLTARQAAMITVIVDRMAPPTVKAVAGFLGVSKPVVSRATDTLEKRGFLVREKDLHDRRRIYIRPTEMGCALRAAMVLA